jgi:transposase-like protein
VGSPWAGLIAGPPVVPKRWRVTCRCPDCDRRHVLERIIGAGERVHVVCHGCETTFWIQAGASA